MKNIKKIVLSIAVVGVLSTSVAFGVVATKTPADITSGLTGKTVEEVISERASGKTYGTIASEAGKLDEFKTESLQQKKLALDQRVKDGNLTQAAADEMYTAIAENQETCDGTGSAGIGRMSGAGFGQGNGQGRGQGMGNGLGQGNGAGCGSYTTQ
ncbi:hypothetical protein [Clostridium sp.]|uniref:hypothetical protein n=1 Tax=Clostridium sp. TaxID=1506 RepID=UPI001A5A810A|nr:hypothetical protein [Clostridium sp.]MBK5235584.1 hypothetical protein [Clostridium sp.]